MSQQRQQQQQPGNMLYQQEEGSASQFYDLQSQMQQQYGSLQQNQNQFLQKKFNEGQQTQQMQHSYLNDSKVITRKPSIDSQFTNQQLGSGMLSGRFGGQPAYQSAATSQPESYRNMTGIQYQQQVSGGAQQKPNYSQQQNNLSAYHTTQADALGMINNFQLKDGIQTQNPLENTMKIPGQNLYYQNQTPVQVQTQNLFQELLKLQSGQFMSTPVTPPPAQTPTGQPTTAQPIFGQGFLNAAQILATIQQIPQAPATPSQQNNNIMALQQLLNINSNLSQYQSMIDQIEKQGPAAGITNPNTVSSFQQIQGAKINPSHIQSPVQNYINYQIPSNHSQNQNLFNQSAVTNAQVSKVGSYYESLQELPSNSALPTPQNYSYMMQSKTQLTSNDGQVLSDQEGQNTYKQSYEPSFNYDTGSKNTVSTGNIKERNKLYDPNLYAGAGIGSVMNDLQNTNQQPVSIQSKGYTDEMYDGGYLHKSPQASTNKSFSQFNPSNVAGRKLEGSPKIAWVSNTTKNNEFGGYNNTQKMSEGKNSPMRQSANRAYMNDMYGNAPGLSQNNMLDSSFNRNAQQNFIPQGYNNMAASQNSSQILQEHHMNSQNTNQIYRQGAVQSQAFNQYSPQGSSYRYDENQMDQVNSSINLGKSQRFASHQQNQSQAMNIDDIPIGGGRPKTFEELLEENLKKMGQDPGTAQNEYDNQRDEVEGDDGKPQKKEFLKRKSLKATAPQNTQIKKYNYYVDNFDEAKKKERSISQAPAPDRSIQSSGFNKLEEIQIYSKQNTNHLEHTPIQNRAVSPLDVGDRDRNSESVADRQKNVQKKPFLTRGSGKAGGKQGHQNPVPQHKQKQQKQTTGKKVPILSDDEYPNDFNFAAEQDNKSPKLNNPAAGQSYLSRQVVQANKKNLETDLNRNSIAEFEKLEQECNRNQALQQQPKSLIEEKRLGNKRRKKLFDDSDSNEDDDNESEIQEVQAYKEDHKIEEQKQRAQPPARNASQNMSENEEAPKSSVVKKFFYKEDPQKSQKNAINPQGSRPPVDMNNSQQHQAALTEHMEKVLKAKMEQLDKAIETYNQQNEQAQRLKREYENLLSKQRVDFRDFEGKKKRELEELERVKNEELEKLKKEKKALEQRQRNLQMVGASNKKEREEIEFLKKEVQRVQEEAKAKETKMKGQIDRLAKQNDELKTANKELNDELKHLNEQLRNAAAQASNKQINAAKSQAEQQNRYTFSTNKSQEQISQAQQQQPKGILKNKEERPVSASHFYNPNQHLDEEDQESHHEDHEQEEDDLDNLDQDLNHQYSDSEENRRIGQQQKVSGQNSSQIMANQPQHNPLANVAEDEQEDYDMKFPSIYHNKNPANMKVIEQIIGHDGKIQRVYENGKKEVIFNNGVKREVFPDGYTIVYFNNNDIKQTYPDQKVVYYFAEAKTTQTTFSDGLQVFKFANNQIEKHFPDGTKEIIFPDGTIKCIFADGEEESIFPDGTIQRIEKNGVKAIEFANGQKDILFPDGTRIREYPDGRVRKTYPDGTCENSFRQQ